MVYGYTGPNSFIFFTKESAYGCGGAGGTQAVPVNPVGGNTHIPFNPMVNFKIKPPKINVESKTFMGNVMPSRYTVGMNPGECSIETVYHAPFLMSKIFPTKTVGAWAADLTATLAFAMTNHATLDESLCLHMHLDDKQSVPEDIDLNFFGGFMNDYEWEIEEKKDLIEKASLKFNNWQAGAIAFNSAATFHNQRYAMWNDCWLYDTASKVRGIPFSAFTVSTYTALDNSIKVKKANFKIISTRSEESFIGADYVQQASKKEYEVEGKITAVLIGDETIDEFIAEWESRTAASYKLLHTSGAFTEYLQCTKMCIEDISEVEIPQLNESPLSGIELTLKSNDDSALTFAGAYDQDQTPVPTNYV